MDEDLDRSVRAWAAHRFPVVREAGYWVISPPSAVGGDIRVLLRTNEHGPIEVVASNDNGWVNRLGCALANLPQTLDFALADVQAWERAGSPNQGNP